MRLARLAVRYRRQARAHRRALVLCQTELRRLRVINMRQAETLRRMDATNAALTHAQAATDFHPPGRFAKETP